MDKLITIWSFICRRKYLITVVAFAVIIGFLDENSLFRRLGYEREISQLKEEIEKYRADYEENTKRLNELSTNPDAIEQVAREKYLMKKPNEDIYVFEDNRMKQLVPALFAVGAIMALTGAAVYITGWNYAPYIYTVGAGCIALAQVNTPVKGKKQNIETPACSADIRCTGTYPDRSLHVYHTRQ